MRARALLALLALFATGDRAAAAEIVRVDPRFDALVPRDASLEKVAEGFAWVEGPLWEPRLAALFFSDVVRNAIYRWREGEGAREFLRPSGYSGTGPFAGREPGANGLALDPEGRLVLCEHGDRRVSRLEADGSRTVLADRYRGKRLNSPNDAVFRRSGELHFTDPPFGLPEGFDDPAKELPFSGVYHLRRDRTLELLTSELRAPNGLGFSPDEDVLYVSNADRAEPVWKAFPVRPDGTLGPPRLFHDGSAWAARWPGVPDGLEVDAAGNVFAAGPGGIHVMAPDGTHLGSLLLGVATSNVAFGPGRAYLFITASDSLYRVRLGHGTRGER